MKSDAFTAEIDAIEELSLKYWIKNVIYYKWDVIEYKDLIKKLEKDWILLYNYSNKEDLKKQILKFHKKYEVIFVSTPMELLVNTVHEIKELLGRPVSDTPDVFRDKFLQRELIQEHNPELWIKFLKWEPDELNIKEIEEKVGYPFIIKPIDWLQSSWVAKINKKNEFTEYIKDYKVFHDRLKNRWVDNKILIVEEFIDGKLYSVDYYVSAEWDIVVSKPVKVKLGIDVWVEDYCNIARIATEKTANDFRWKRLKTFINSTVKATWVKNIFIHHEFKINSKWEFKTIELNGRIGWGRLNLLKRTYWINMYEFLVKHDIKVWKLKENNIYLNIYATKRGTLKSFNKKLLEKIKKRKTVKLIETEDSFIDKEVWLTKDWFVKLGWIKLASKSYKDIRKDYLYIKWKYADLIDIDEWCCPPKKKKSKKWLLHKVKYFFVRRK